MYVLVTFIYGLTSHGYQFNLVFLTYVLHICVCSCCYYTRLNLSWWWGLFIQRFVHRLQSINLFFIGSWWGTLIKSIVTCGVFDVYALFANIICRNFNGHQVRSLKDLRVVRTLANDTHGRLCVQSIISTEFITIFMLFWSLWSLCSINYIYRIHHHFHAILILVVPMLNQLKPTKFVPILHLSL